MVEYTSWAEYWWDNTPAPFNPHYDPAARARYARVTESIERDGFYDTHSREECAAEWRKRYDADKGE